MAAIASLAVAVAFLLDATVGEPPESVHPVAKLGAAIAVLDHPGPAPHLYGATVALVVPLLAAGLAALPVWLLAPGYPVLAGVLAGTILFTTVSLDMLTELSSTVIGETDADLERAKTDVVGLVGRDTADLSAAEVRSAAVESLAENLADGLVGPLLAFAFGSFVSLPVAVGAAAWVKAVNTLDSMLGYRDRPHGTASARLDDVVEWLPARLSAGLIASAALDPSALTTARTWAHEPASPNSGWPMATMATAIGVRLHKSDQYDLNPTARLPTVADARGAITVGHRAGLLAFALAAGIAWIGGNAGLLAGGVGWAGDLLSLRGGVIEWF
ncbi:MAG: adenosylcobinamide-phosphate synthase CbiB [Halodesulfurarchaeum sp.]|nr:adenosylcobinamide-phosphate synthase CbiB [Halodesulfurarchaeum sp.]